MIIIVVESKLRQSIFFFCIINLCKDKQPHCERYFYLRSEMKLLRKLFYLFLGRYITSSQKPSWYIRYNLIT